MIWRWQDRLEKALADEREEARTKNVIRLITLDTLFSRSRAPSKSKLIDAIESKISSGELSVIYKLISPETKAVIAEYESVLDIPEHIYDDTAGQEIAIDPLSDIEVVFRVGPNG